MINLSKETIVFEPGQKICQAMFIKVEHPKFVEVAEYTSKSERGVAGFGSTGKK